MYHLQQVSAATSSYTLDLNAGLTQVLADGTNTYLYGNYRTLHNRQNAAAKLVAQDLRERG